jgi:moderate conductance mechanosensitive channel
MLADATASQLRHTCGQDPDKLCREILDHTGNGTLADIADFVFGKPLTIVLIALGALLANKVIGRAMNRGLRSLSSGIVRERMSAVRRRTPAALLEAPATSLRAEQRLSALTSVLRSVTGFVIGLLACFMVLAELGVDVGPLLAGAGVLGVALGFGSQSLVKDFLSGLFILAEDQFGVGDVVDLDGQTQGTVEAVSLRTTRLRSVDGTVWHVPNGAIGRVGNKSQHWSRALLDVEVAYDTNIDHASEVIKRVADSVWKERDEVLEEPQVWGVEKLAANAIVIRLVVKTLPADQYGVSRQLRQRLKEEFDREGIEIPFPQQTVWHRSADNGDGAKSDGSEPVAGKPDGGEPVAGKPDGGEPVAGKPDGGVPAAAKPASTATEPAPPRSS